MHARIGDLKFLMVRIGLLIDLMCKNNKLIANLSYWHSCAVMHFYPSSTSFYITISSRLENYRAICVGGLVITHFFNAQSN